MRLIDADALLEEMKNDKWCEDYLGEDVAEGIYDYVEQASTAFDLESVIEDFESKLECTKIQLELLNDCENKDSLSVKNDICFFKERAERYEEFLEILKSAAKSTNGKNGG